VKKYPREPYTMKRTPPFPFLPDLETPMRDAMRGVANFAEATEDALEPAAQLLPEPLRAGFQMAIKSLEATGKQLIDQGFKQDQVISAGDFATGQVRNPGSAKDFSKVACFAWEHLQQATDEQRFMISEMILARKSAQYPETEAGAAHAAGLVEAIRMSSAIGRMPGLSDGIGPEDRSQIDMMLLAIMVWLLATRADGPEEELKLLELAMALVTAIKDDVVSAMDDQAKLADILAATSAHL